MINLTYPVIIFFKYLQLRNFIRTHQNQTLCIPEMSTIEKLMNLNCLGRGLISKIYRCLEDGSTEASAGRLEAWREDLQEAIPIEKWGEACSKAQSRTTNTRLKLLQYNWLMRTYITPETLNRYNSAITDVCIKYEKEKGTFFPFYLAMYRNRKILARNMYSKYFTDSNTLSPTVVYIGSIPR